MYIETSLNVPFPNIEKLINKNVNFIIDIKTIDSDIYKKYTNKDNSFVLANLNEIARLGLQDKCKIRIPNIPNYTNKEIVNESKEYLTDLKFENLEIFEYIIRK